MLETLKQRVLEANLELVRKGLVILTWGNASGRDPETGLVVIKPSGVSYTGMKAEDMTVIDPEGKIVEGHYKPSTDAPTHLVLYRTYGDMEGIVHTHSTYATSWAQAGKAIPAFGTTHADHFRGEVQVTRMFSPEEIENDYELNTGKIIVETLGNNQPLGVPAVLVDSHGPFCWGKNVEDAVYNAIALEEIARMAFNTIIIGRERPSNPALLLKHFNRKHGPDAYYGQEKNKK